MAFSPLSFLLGVAAAWALPAMSRSFRPLAVEATAFGLGLLEDARRMAAEQMENFEDIAAEARARREQMAAGPAAIHADESEESDAEDTGEEHADAADVSANGRGRRRASRGRSRAT